MAASVLVAYASRYGSTKEVAEAIAARLKQSGAAARAVSARDVKSLEGYDAVVIGAPIYIGSLLKEAVAFMEGNRDRLTALPTALFALGPLATDADPGSGAEQLETVLAKMPWFHPVERAVFVGAYDPAHLRMADRIIAVLPASPLHGLPASDGRDWDAIAQWADTVSAALQVHA